MEAVAVTCVVARGLMDALETLLPEPAWSAQLWQCCGQRRVCLGCDAWRSSACPVEQLWTRDPRGSRVRSDSPRIPHGKVTKWQSTRIKPCQEVIIG